MQFSLLNAVRNLPDSAYDLRDVYADYISDAVLGEELGFVRSWYGEHHFRECQWTGSPIQVCTAVAARTSSDCGSARRWRCCRSTTRSGSPRTSPSATSSPAAGSTSASARVRNTRSSSPSGSIRSEMSRPDVGVDRLDHRGLSSSRRVQPHGSLLRHPRHDLHHQAGAGPDADLVRRDGAPEPAARRRARHSSSSGRSIPATTLNSPPPGATPSTTGGLDADGLRRRLRRCRVGRSPDRRSSTSSTSTRPAKTSQGVPADDSKRVTAEMIRAGQAGFWSAAVGTPDDVIAALTPFVTGALGRITELAVAFRHAGMRTTPRPIAR